MSIDNRNQLKTSYQDSITFQGRQLIQQMTPESRQHLMDIVQSRMSLGGDTIVNRELYNSLKSSLEKNNKKGGKK